MIVIYCPRVSEGARELTAWLNANGEPTKKIRHIRRMPPGNKLVVSWGQRLPGVEGLNTKAPVGNKFVELGVMIKAGVPTPRVSLQPYPGWWARLHRHQAGNDLLAKLRVGEYYVEPIPTIAEFRCHVFKEKVFRTGTKFPNEEQHHPQIRTSLAGWGLSYDRDRLEATGVKRKRIREAAIAAVKALGYDFGAVDVGVKQDGTAVVFEVNSAPGLEGVTIQRYGEQIKAYKGGM